MALRENKLWGVEDKVQIAIERLKTFEPPEGYYLAFSGGKDSQCIYHLAKMAGVKFDAHYNVTGIDPPDLYYFIKDNYPSVKRHPPKITLWKLIEKKKMLPTRIVRYCCDFLKERGGSGRIVVTGIRSRESVKRSARKIVESCYKDKTKTYLNPIIDWEESDVWEFLNDNKIPHCRLYDEGWKRIGCLGCPMSNKMEELMRYPGIKRLFDRSIQRLINTTDNQPYSTIDEAYDWWFQKSIKGTPDQTVMFE